jgi:hypothetical protein
MPSFQVFLRFRKEDYDTWIQAKAFAKKNGLTLGRLVALALQYYMNKDDKILQKLDEIEALLKNGSFVPKQSAQANVVVSSNSYSKDAPNLSFFKDNAWLEILSQRGKE